MIIINLVRGGGCAKGGVTFQGPALRCTLFPCLLQALSPRTGSLASWLSLSPGQQRSYRRVCNTRVTKTHASRRPSFKNTSVCHLKPFTYLVPCSDVDPSLRASPGTLCWSYSAWTLILPQADFLCLKLWAQINTSVVDLSCILLQPQGKELVQPCVPWHSVFSPTEWDTVIVLRIFPWCWSPSWP